VATDVVEAGRDVFELLADDVLVLERGKGPQRCRADLGEQLADAATLLNAGQEQNLQGFEFPFNPLDAVVGPAEEALFQMLEIVALRPRLGDDGPDALEGRFGVGCDFFADLTDRGRNVEKDPLVVGCHPGGFHPYGHRQDAKQKVVSLETVARLAGMGQTFLDALDLILL